MRVVSILLLLLCNISLADIPTSVEVVTAITGIGEYRQVDDALLVKDGKNIKISSIGAVTFDIDKSFALTAWNDQNQTVATTKVTDKTYLVQGPGRIRFMLTIVDFDAKTVSQEVAIVTIPAGPDTPPGPDPGPGPTPIPPLPPNGPFDGLAVRVQEHAKYLTPAARNQIAGIVNSAADKMRTFEFKQVTQASEYIKKNWPPCQDQHCAALWKLVLEDSKTRLLSWQETQAYYREVAKGVL